MSQNPRTSVRTRLGQTARSVKASGNENVALKHQRQPSIGAQRVPVPSTKATAPQRTALGELTTTTVNRLKQSFIPSKDKDTKAGRSSTIPLIAGARRVPVAKTQLPTASTSSALRKPLRVSSVPVAARPPLQPLLEDVGSDPAEDEDEAEDLAIPQRDDDAMSIEMEREVDEAHDEEVEAMIEAETDDEEVVEPTARIEVYDDFVAEQDQEDELEFVWPNLPPTDTVRMQCEVEAVRELYEDPEDTDDPSLVSEYSTEILQYMHQLEIDMMPDPDYIRTQTEVTWEMRETLVDWMLQAHLRYHLLAETLWIAINIVDRFLSNRDVSVGKLQLVGITALFVAAKYEEILAPSVDEFVRLTEGGYTRDEILKGERIVLASLDFKISDYCSPYTWIRKISKADDYSMQTRTLCKFLVEVTLMDYHFLRVKPSLIAAIGMYTARRMLGGDWNDAFVFHSGYTEEFLRPGYHLLAVKMASEGFANRNVSKKYMQKRFLRASSYAIEWAQERQAAQAEAEAEMEE